MKRKKLIVGSRESKLAVIQSEIIIAEIKKHYPKMEVELVTMKTTGDIILDRTLDKIGGKGLFVKELEQALYDGKIDIIVNSMKDMPAQINDELPIIAIPEREDPRDVLVLPQGITELDLVKPVGCAGLRRKLQFLELFGDIKVEPVRGNVLTRLRKLDDGLYSALGLAYAGLKRLELEHRVSRVFSTQEIIPSAGQGTLAVQGRKDEDWEFIKAINDADAIDSSLAEREFIKVVDGGCSSPIAAFAELNGTEIAEVTPGITSKGILWAAKSSSSSPPRPNKKESPPFRRTTLLPKRACSNNILFISDCGTG